MIRAAILALALIALVSAQQPAPAPTTGKWAPGGPVPESVIGFNSGDFGFSVKVTPPAEAGKNFQSVKAAKEGMYGLMVNVTKAGTNTSDVEVLSPWWRLGVDKRYMFKVAVKSIPAPAAPVTLSVERRSGCCKGKVVATKEFVAGPKYDTFSLSYLNKQDKDYRFVIGVGKMVSTYRIDTVNVTTVARKMSGGKATPQIALGTQG